MATRVPLVIDASLLHLKELPTTDNLNLSASAISSVGDINSSGVITATSFSGTFSGNTSGNAAGLTGSPTITVTDITGRHLNLTGVSTFAAALDVNSNANISGFIDVDGQATLDDLNVAGVSTFAGALDVNNNVDVSGFIDVDGQATLDDLNVAGVSTLGGAVDINNNVDVSGFIDVDGQATLDDLNVAGVSTLGGAVDINSNVDISGFIDVDGQATLDDLNVSGVATVTGVARFDGAIDANSRVDINLDLDVNGKTDLDDLSVAGVSTFAAAINANSGVVGNLTGNATGLSGSPSIVVQDVTAEMVSVAGTMQYEDVVNIDSIGIVTARTGVHIDDSITHIGDPNTKIRFPGADTFTIETGGTERGRFDSTGLFSMDGKASLGKTATGVPFAVGDGGTSGDRVLQFKRAARTNDINIQAVNSGTGATNLLLNADGGNVGINQSNPTEKLDVNGTIQCLNELRSTTGNDLLLNAGSANRDVKIQVNDVNMMYVQGSTGKIGMGIDTGWLDKVCIKNDVSAGTDNWALHLLNGTHAADSRIGIAFQGNNATAANTWDGAGIYAANNGVDGACHTMFGSVVDGSFSERLRITSSGNLGINDTTPDVELSVAAVSGNAPCIDIGQAGSERFKIGYEGNNCFMGASSNTGMLIWKNNVTANGHPQSSGTEQFRIDQAGRLSLKGDTDTFLDRSGTNEWTIKTNDTVCTIFRANQRVWMPTVWSTNGSSMRDVQIESDGNLCAGNTSIRAAKKNITPQTDVSWLYDLNPVTFNYRKKIVDEITGVNTYLEEIEEETSYGLIAEEVETVKKDFCFYNKDEDGNDELAGVAYRSLITPLLKAVQDQKKAIYFSSGDKRLDENIKSITNATDKIKALEGRTFNRRSSVDDTETQYGFISQEVETVIPEFVSEKTDTKLVNVNGVIPILVEALKETLTEIDILKGRITELES